jgi:hypothetical protein
MVKRPCGPFLMIFSWFIDPVDLWNVKREEWADNARVIASPIPIPRCFMMFRSFVPLPPSCNQTWWAAKSPIFSWFSYFNAHYDNEVRRISQLCLITRGSFLHPIPVLSKLHCSAGVSKFLAELHMALGRPRRGPARARCDMRDVSSMFFAVGIQYTLLFSVVFGVFFHDIPTMLRIYSRLYNRLVIGDSPEFVLWSSQHRLFDIYNMSGPFTQQ